MTATTPRFAESIDALAGLAPRVGFGEQVLRDEGLRVAAAVIEAVPDAAQPWARVAAPDAAGDLAQANRLFFDAAVRGRRWRLAPTDVLGELVATRSPLAAEYAEALTDVVASALTLGSPSPQVTARAVETAGLYSAAAAGRPAPAAEPTLDDMLRRAGLPPIPPRIEVPGPLEVPGRPAGPAAPGPVAAGPAGLDHTRPGPTASGAPEAHATAAPTAQPVETQEPAEPEKTVDELLAELDAMIGLGRVKKEIHRQVALLTVEKMRTEAGLRAPRMSRHLIFVGNPGTGKTTVARLVGSIYRALGLLPEGQLVEVDRSELVAGYVGQTAIKTAEVIDRAVGGVLFIDEAYGLTGDQYAQEAVNTLVKGMEDHREDLVVIVAGYPEPMVGFIAQNPGLASRFTTTIEFDDYSDDELMAILESIATASDYTLADDARKRVRDILSAAVRGPSFGNGRFARNLFEAAVGRHAWRLRESSSPTREELSLLTREDFVENEPEAGPDTDPESAPEDAPTSEGEQPT